MTPYHRLSWKDKKPFRRLPPPRESTSIESCMPGCLKAYTMCLANQIHFLVDRHNGEVCFTDIWGKWCAMEGQKLNFKLPSQPFYHQLISSSWDTTTGHWFTYTEVTVSSTVVWVIFSSAQIFLTAEEKDFCYCKALSYSCALEAPTCLEHQKC